ncbi:hypothetical protein BaRGS_00016271 [Batillaria attramentaria]|uniref:Uncharacterized protein n=1 Tax=Batillaria attramentaria TaxID=370345 RepID=A0ABD0KYM7_9CAEN
MASGWRNKCLCLCFIVFLHSLRVADCLSCYSCHYENVQQACLETEVTCEWGEVCFNTVYRQSQYNGVTVITSKGCKLRGECEALQRLNEDSYCEATPSECVYCCDEDRCNGAQSLSPVYSALVLTMMVLKGFVNHML